MITGCEDVISVQVHLKSLMGTSTTFCTFTDGHIGISETGKYRENLPYVLSYGAISVALDTSK